MGKSMAVPQKLGRKWPYDPGIPLLGLHPEEFKAGTQTDICTPTFIAALFTVAKRWKQSKGLPTEAWINKLWCRHVMKLYSVL